MDDEEHKKTIISNSSCSNGSTQNNTPIPKGQNLLQQVPLILESKHLRCLHHTPASAQKLHDTYGFFANGREMSHEVEQHLFDAFIEDDYDGLLHLTTLHSYPTYQPPAADEDNCWNDMGPPMGLVFWRQVPDREMQEWFDWNHVMKALSNPSQNMQVKVVGTLPEGDRTMTSSVNRRKMHFVRQNSVESIQQMIESLHVSSRSLIDNAPKEMTHAWIKLELIAVRECYWGQHLGSLLLACALYHAHDQYDQSRVILHVAGGEENIPAVKLYERFGFLSIPQGTVFHKPDKYMYVLGDIRYALRNMTWRGEHVEAIPIIYNDEQDAS